MIVLNQVPLKLSAEEALAVGGLGRIANKLRNLNTLLEECESLIKPTAIYTYMKIEKILGEAVLLEQDKLLRSSKLAEQLKCASEVAPYIVTIGPELERRVSAIGQSRLLDSWVLDNLGTYSLRLLTRYMEERVKAEKGWTISKFNPGSTQSWDLEQQEVLFNIFSREKVQQSLGVVLSDKYVMIPRKTVSGIMGQTITEHHNCQECQKPCEYRQKPFRTSA